MSVPTLCRIASTLSLSTDYILFGKQEKKDKSWAFKALAPMIESSRSSTVPRKRQAGDTGRAADLVFRVRSKVP